MVKQPSLMEYLESGIRGASLREALIARNVANQSTPGYKRSAVKFEKLLTEAIESGKPVDLEMIKAEIFQPMNTPTDSSGNDVVIEVEIGEMIQIQGMLKTYLRLLGKLYGQMEIAASVP